MYYFRTLQNNQIITHMNTYEYCYEMTKKYISNTEIYRYQTLTIIDRRRLSGTCVIIPDAV